MHFRGDGILGYWDGQCKRGSPIIYTKAKLLAQKNAANVPDVEQIIPRWEGLAGPLLSRETLRASHQNYPSRDTFPPRGKHGLKKRISSDETFHMRRLFSTNLSESEQVSKG